MSRAPRWLQSWAPAVAWKLCSTSPTTCTKQVCEKESLRQRERERSIPDLVEVVVSSQTFFTYSQQANEKLDAYCDLFWHQQSSLFVSLFADKHPSTKVITACGLMGSWALRQIKTTLHWEILGREQTRDLAASASRGPPTTEDLGLKKRTFELQKKS